jgi:hypothetical protein
VKYTVTWIPSAQADATTMWLRSRLRYAISEAIDQLDSALASHPLAVGESRSGRLRVEITDILVLWFRVFPEDRRVEVMGIKLVGPRHPPGGS